jgi:hypothetical protein
MIDPQDCWAKLRTLADTGSGDPRKAAAAIVRQFADGAAKKIVGEFQARLEDTLLAGKYTIVPLTYLDQHRRWLAVLEGACAEIRGGNRKRA